MKTNLYFVRHAHSTYTPEELERPLSEQGQLDALYSTELLKQEKIDFVISSPYKRAVQTVEGIANHLNLKIVIEEDFKERELSKKPVKDFDYVIRKVWEDYNLSWDEGESNLTAQKRGVEVTQKILKQYKGKNIAIGTHGNIMVLIMNYYNPKYDFQFWQELNMPDIYKLTFDEDILVEVKRIWNR
jgi:2,3-bisphosphoglycerate-dependent phosphoglycerate mutase